MDMSRADVLLLRSANDVVLCIWSPFNPLKEIQKTLSLCIFQYSERSFVEAIYSFSRYFFWPKSVGKFIFMYNDYLTVFSSLWTRKTKLLFDWRLANDERKVVYWMRNQPWLWPSIASSFIYNDRNVIVTVPPTHHISSRIAIELSFTSARQVLTWVKWTKAIICLLSIIDVGI